MNEDDELLSLGLEMQNAGAAFEHPSTALAVLSHPESVVAARPSRTRASFGVWVVINMEIHVGNHRK